MGFILSILYFVISYLTPEAMFGSLASFHIQLILAMLTLLVSIPMLLRSSIFKALQSWSLLGLALAAFLSMLIGVHWLGGAVNTIILVVSRILAFFFICLHFGTKKKLKVLTVVLYLICLFITIRGASDLRHVSGSYGPPIDPQSGSADFAQWDAEHPYLFPMRNEYGEWFYRVRGLGMIHDPNDFAQLLVCVIPLIFIFWQPKRSFRNIALVIIPVATLAGGVFLTHSRGSLLALTVVATVAGRRKIGTIPSVVLAGCFLIGAMAIQFAGGREISPGAGEDRTALWGESIAVFRTHPFFGVGLDQLPEYTDGYLTAHNSVIVCAAELGLFGFYFWSVFLFTSLKNAYAISSPERMSDAAPIVIEDSPFPRPVRAIETLDKEEISTLGRSVFLSLIGYLATGWFLSRAIVITLFILGGLAFVVYQMALDRGMISKRLSLVKTLQYSAALAFCLLLALYLMVRVLNFVR